jgi:putative membrane protein
MLEASIKKNDNQAKWLIGIFSVVVFAVVVLLGNFKLTVNLGFNVHLFATLNAFLNTCTAFLLVFALFVVKISKNYALHKRMMVTCLILSVVFLVSYIAHHLLAGEAKFGDANHDGIVSDLEKQQVGNLRYVYYTILSTHIFLASVILPFILFTAYRGLTGEYAKHKKLARITWPLWFYVAVTGPVVYFLISPYYH